MNTTFVDFNPDMIGFPDGSVKDRRAGAGYTLSNRNDLFREYTIRLKDDSTINECEWWAVFLCIESAIELNTEWRRLIIFTDNQSIVKSWERIQNGINSHVETNLFELNNSLVRHKRKVQIQWIPSHSNIHGNEIADTLAKQATRLPNHSITPFISPVPVLYKTMIVYQKQIANWWKKNRSMKSIFYNDKPDFTISTLHENLLYQETKWITWIRTNAMPLNGHLSKMKLRNDNLCSCSDESRQQVETIDHFLFHCPRFNLIRQKWILPHRSNQQPHAIIDIIGSPTGRHDVLQFIQASKRFERTS